MAKAMCGNVFATGGGIYVAIGKLYDGNFFVADNFGSIEIYNSDVIEEDEYGDLVAFDYEWCEEHSITENYERRDLVNMVLDFYARLDGKEDGIEAGFEDFGNYYGKASEIMDFDPTDEN